MYLQENDGVYKIKQEYLDKLKELKKENDRVSKELKALSNAITSEIKETFSETTHFGDYNFVVKGGFYSLEFDEERFKEEQPSLYMYYLKPTQSKVSYTLVSAIREKKEG